MEELLVKINYLIREKLWCSIRSLCDEVSRVFKHPIIASPISFVSSHYRSWKKVQTPCLSSGKRTESSTKVTSTKRFESFLESKTVGKYNTQQLKR